jgi:hypothetical protein
MIARNVTEKELREALAVINKERYEGNIIFNRFDPCGRGWRFTLRCKTSKGLGHGLGYQYLKSGERRRTIAACWHVHGHFFEALFLIKPVAEIKARTRTITIDGGNWEDWNAGSIMDPIRASQKCDCWRDQNLIKTGTLHKSGLISNARVIKQGNLTAECWIVQMQGLKACETCEALNTPDCGGQKIRKQGKNEKGLAVPV